MKIYFSSKKSFGIPISFLIILLLIIGTTSLKAKSWQGIWQSNFGALRLIQIDDKVYGDYALRGTIEGTINGNTVKGIFTNKDRSGIFEWTLTNEGIFKGKWAWDGGTLGSNWDATIVDPSRPTTLTRWQGTWNTKYGIVKLVQEGTKVYGDYSTVGKIVAEVKGDKLIGYFTNGSRRGNFEWTHATRKFTGKWGWKSEPMNQEWTGDWAIARTPSVENKPNYADDQVLILLEPNNGPGVYEVSITSIARKQNSMVSELAAAVGGDGIFAQYYGSIGIRAYGENYGQSRELASHNGSSPRVWNVSKQHPKRTQLLGDLMINKSRRFVIGEEHFEIGKRVAFNIQANLGEKDVLFDDNYSWVQKNIYLDELSFYDKNWTQTQLIVTEDTHGSHFQLIVNIKIEKIE